jgi:hypothetical protein
LVTNPGDLMYYGVDGALDTVLMISSKVIDPCKLGGGYTS